MPTEFARVQMITQQVRAWDVLDDRVLAAMRQVPRERFVPERYRELAFADTEIPLAHGQHMLAPKVVGRILQALEVSAGARALEIGTGSAYLSACLAQLGAAVRSYEIHAAIASQARSNLVQAQTRGVEVLEGNAFLEALGDSYTHIAVTGSLPLYTDRFAQALAVGGRLFIVVGQLPMMEAQLITRISATEWRTEVLFETVLAPLDGAPQPPAFAF
jgi:protein-L-isoaspartate(D-aspartate) O-methyltransferase